MGGEVDRPHAGPTTGFSLIELLVVIAILSVLSIGGVLAVGRGESRAASDLTRFRETFDLQRALAVEGREVRGLRIGPEGLQPMQRRRDEVVQWHPLGQPVAWRGEGVAILTEQPVPVGEPEIVFLPAGRSTAFSVVFDDRRRCVFDGWGALAC